MELERKERARSEEHRRLLEQVEAEHARAAEALERLYERKLWMEARRARELHDKQQDTELSMRLALRNLSEAHAAQLCELKEQHRREVQQRDERISQLERLLGAAKQETEQLLTEEVMGRLALVLTRCCAAAVQLRSHVHELMGQEGESGPMPVLLCC